MDTVYLDAESWSECSLKEAGADVYCNDPSTRAILWGALCESQPRALCFEEHDPFVVLEQLRARRRLKWTKTKAPLLVLHWNSFDRLLAQAARPDGWSERSDTYGVRGPLNTLWVDLAELALTAGLPFGLNAASIFVGQELKAAGSKLISLFCGPHPCEPEEHPVEWEEFKSYCAQDVQALRPIWHALREAGVTPGEHAERSWAVRRMNARGVRSDVESARHVLDRLSDAQERAEATVEDRYGFRTSQVKLLSDFLGLPNAKATTIENALAMGILDSDQVFVAEARLGLAGAARKKLKPLAGYADPVDDRIRGGFIYHGAWTGRLTSLGVQFQNFVREPSDPAFFADLASCPSDEMFARTRSNIRGFLRAEEGYTLVGSDYSAIELRVGAWLAGEQWLLDAFENGVDPYRIQAAAQFGLSGPDAVSKEQRQYGKVVELAAMYGQGPHGFQKRRALEGEQLPIEQCATSISIFRQTHPAFVKAWKECDNALRWIIMQPDGAVFDALDGKVCFARYPNSVTIIRPCGATQVLWMPSIVEGEWPDGSPREEIAFVAKDSQTGYMQHARTYGANVFQNLVQGVAFDLMIEALVRVETHGLCPVLSIHDEIVCEVPKDLAESALMRLEHLMAYGNHWSNGIPITVESWISERFTKA